MKSGKLAVCLLLSVQLVTSLTLFKSISWDPSYGMLAAQQYVKGVSPSPFKIVEADPVDIRRLKAHDVPFWAPLYQGIPLLFRFGVLSWGQALNLTTATLLLLGTLGWWSYFRQVLGTSPLADWLVVVVLCTRFCWMNSVTYDGGNLLSWGFTPWAVVLTIKAMRAPKDWASILLSMAGGLLAGMLFITKYSAVFVSVGIFLALILLCFRYRALLFRAGAWTGGMVCSLLVIHLLGFPGAHAAMADEFQPLRGLLSLGLWPVGVTDLETMAGKPLTWLHLQGENWTPALGLVLLIPVLLSIFIYRMDRQNNLPPTPDQSEGNGPANIAGVIATTAALVDIAVFFLLIVIGGHMSLHGRFGRVSGLLFLPLLCVAWAALWRGRSRFGKTLACFCVVVFLVIPAMYGPLSVLPKLVHDWHTRETATGPDRVVNQALAPGTNHRAFYDELTRGSR